MLRRFSGVLNPYILFIWLTKAAVWAFTAVATMISVFVIGDLSVPPNYSNCSARDGGSTLTCEFRLTGQHAGLAVLTSYLLGEVIGGAIFPALSDRVGRRKVLCSALFAFGAVGVGSAYAPHLYNYTLLRSLQGVFYMGSGIPAMILAYESIPLYLRSYTTMMFGMNWVVGYCAAAPLAYYFPDWRQLTVIASAATMLYAVLLALYSRTVQYTGHN